MFHHALWLSNDSFDFLHTRCVTYNETAHTLDSWYLEQISMNYLASFVVSRKQFHFSLEYKSLFTKCRLSLNVALHTAKWLNYFITNWFVQIVSNMHIYVLNLTKAFLVSISNDSIREKVPLSTFFSIIIPFHILKH